MVVYAAGCISLIGAAFLAVSCTASQAGSLLAVNCNQGSRLVHKCFCDPGWMGAHCQQPNPLEPKVACNTTHDTCYQSRTYGVCRVSEERWQRAQKAEHSHWTDTSASAMRDDRVQDHLQGFDGYKAVPNFLGHVAEFGCGPWTQLGFMLDQRKTWIVDSISLWEPGADVYRRSVPTCAYKDGTLRGRPVEVFSQGAEKCDAHAKYDTVMMVNVLEHVLNLYEVLDNLYTALKPGGILIICERWWDSFDHNTPATGDHLLHPIKCNRVVFEYFLAHFTPLFRSDNPPAITKYKGYGDGTYFVGMKKEF